MFNSHERSQVAESESTQCICQEVGITVPGTTKTDDMQAKKGTQACLTGLGRGGP